MTVRHFGTDICVEGYIFGLFGPAQPEPARSGDADTSDDAASQMATEY
jgi:hypothetical protein